MYDKMDLRYLISVDYLIFKILLKKKSFGITYVNNIIKLIQPG